MAENRTILRVAAVVSNAGRFSVDEVSTSLTRHLGPFVGIQVHAVGSSTEATAAAEDAARTADTVIAVGGDGTVADVATGIFGSGAALGIVPAGSTNITARSLGVPETPEQALAVFGGQTHFRSIDVGRSGNRSFLHIAGAGFDAKLFKIANPVWKRRVGWVAYLPAAIAALGLPTSVVRITADETEIVAQSSLVLIANGGSAIAPEFKIYPGISVEDGMLDVLVFSSSTPAEIAAILWHAGTQRLHQSPHVKWHPARTVRIDATPPLPVELDGDLRGETPCDFHVVPRGLSIVLPGADS